MVTRLPVKELNGRHAGKVLIEVGVDDSLERARLPERVPQFRPQIPRDDDHHRQHRECYQPDLEVVKEQRPGKDQDQKQVLYHSDQTLRQKLVDSVHIARNAGHQATDRVPVEVTHAEPLKLGK